MDILTNSHPVSRLEVVDTGRRRRWTDAEKFRIVEESYSGPRLASATARRHGISNKLIFAWRKAWREGRLGGSVSTGFVPVVTTPDRVSAYVPRTPGGRMEVVCGNGFRVIVEPDFDSEALIRLLQVLERR